MDRGFLERCGVPSLRGVTKRKSRTRTEPPLCLRDIDDVLSNPRCGFLVEEPGRLQRAVPARQLSKKATPRLRAFRSSLKTVSARKREQLKAHPFRGRDRAFCLVLRDPQPAVTELLEAAGRLDEFGNDRKLVCVSRATEKRVMTPGQQTYTCPLKP